MIRLLLLTALLLACVKEPEVQSDFISYDSTEVAVDMEYTISDGVGVYVMTRYIKLSEYQQFFTRYAFDGDSNVLCTQAEAIEFIHKRNELYGYDSTYDALGDTLYSAGYRLPTAKEVKDANRQSDTFEITPNEHTQDTVDILNSTRRPFRLAKSIL